MRRKTWRNARLCTMACSWFVESIQCFELWCVCFLRQMNVCSCNWSFQFSLWKYMCRGAYFEYFVHSFADVLSVYILWKSIMSKCCINIVCRMFFIFVPKIMCFERSFAAYHQIVNIASSPLPLPISLHVYLNQMMNHCHRGDTQTDANKYVNIFFYSLELLV